MSLVPVDAQHPAAGARAIRAQAGRLDVLDVEIAVQTSPYDPGVSARCTGCTRLTPASFTSPPRESHSSFVDEFASAAQDASYP
ncbi:MAG: hypothetical protein WEB50_10920 [Vicinamibacterales bacterium]